MKAAYLKAFFSRDTSTPSQEDTGLGDKVIALNAAVVAGLVTKL